VASALVFVLITLSAFGTAVASENSGGWRLEPGFDLRAATHYRYNDGKSTTYPSLGAHLGFDLTVPEPAFGAGLFADYELAMDSAQTNFRLAGGWARYSFGRWELSTAGVHFAVPRATGLWLSVNRLQFRPRDGHKISLEAISPLSLSGNPALQLIYETDVTRRVSLSINAGLGSNRLQDFGASTQFVWNLR
jgi:hypothetical protein